MFTSFHELSIRKLTILLTERGGIMRDPLARPIGGRVLQG
jgi:hypothetical protein